MTRFTLRSIVSFLGDLAMFALRWRSRQFEEWKRVRNFRLPRVAVSVVLLAGLLASCGNGDESDAAKPTRAPSSSSSPTKTVETVPPQPKGAYGVTTAITNWDEYYDNEAVVAWKRINEATYASFNRGKLLPEFRRSYSRAVEKQWLDAFAYAVPRKMKLPRRGDVRIATARTRGRETRIVTCLWAPTTDYVGTGEKNRFWRKQTVRIQKKSDRWRVTALVVRGRCKGGAPR